MLALFPTLQIPQRHLHQHLTCHLPSHWQEWHTPSRKRYLSCMQTTETEIPYTSPWRRTSLALGGIGEFSQTVSRAHQHRGQGSQPMPTETTNAFSIPSSNCHRTCSRPVRLRQCIRLAAGVATPVRQQVPGAGLPGCHGVYGTRA